MRVQGIEIDARNDLKPQDLSATAMRQLRKMLDDLNLRVTAVRFPTRRGYDDPEDLDRRVSATKDAMRMAVDLGCDNLINSAGQVGDLEGESMKLMQEVLSDLGRHSYHYGCFLCCRTGFEPLASLQAMLESLPEQSVFIALDSAALIGGGFEAGPIGPIAPLVRTVYASDCVPDRSRTGQSMRVPLGQGLVDFPELLATLEDGKYRGPYIVEGYGKDPVTSAKQACQFLRQV